MGRHIRRGTPTHRWARVAEILAVLTTLAAPWPASVAGQDVVPPATVVELGTCPLANGTEIPDCRVAYRAYGPLNAARDNVVVIPTFFAGRSEDHAFMLGTYVDTTRHHVLIVDALADGHSSSPSNTGPAARPVFEGLTIGDMVDSQRRLLDALGISRVRAVVGISMGGFQAFEWAVRYPDAAEMVVAVVGTPRPMPSDRVLYAALVEAAEQARAAGLSGVDAWMHPSRIETLFMGTRRAMDAQGLQGAEADVSRLASSYAGTGWVLEDYAAQARALGRHDISARFGGDLSAAAQAVRARMLVVTTPDDQIVSPGPAAEFARLVGAEVLAVPSPCGHAVFWCEDEALGGAVRAFLEAGGREVAAPPAIGSRGGPER